MVDAPNVTPIRQDPAASPAMATAHTSENGEPDHPLEQQQQQVAAAGAAGVEDRAKSGLGFESPFEDELDTPAFLRKRSGGADDDQDVPAFMRRGGSD
jgi:hypothetical protein